jgi:hypothetical protein
MRLNPNMFIRMLMNYWKLANSLRILALMVLIAILTQSPIPWIFVLGFCLLVTAYMVILLLVNGWAHLRVLSRFVLELRADEIRILDLQTKEFVGLAYHDVKQVQSEGGNIELHATQSIHFPMGSDLGVFVQPRFASMKPVFLALFLAFMNRGSSKPSVVLLIPVWLVQCRRPWVLRVLHRKGCPKPAVA